MVVVGIPHSEKVHVGATPLAIVFNQLKIVGSIVGSRADVSRLDLHEAGTGTSEPRDVSKTYLLPNPHSDWMNRSPRHWI
jgi:hypothetical protein